MSGPICPICTAIRHPKCRVFLLHHILDKSRRCFELCQLSYTPSLSTVVNKVFSWSSWTRTNNLCFPIQIKHLVCCIRLIFIYKIFIFLNYHDRIYLILLYLLSYSSNQLRLSLIRLEPTTHILTFNFCCYCHIN